jgi:hypothetical protein
MEKPTLFNDFSSLKLLAQWLPRRSTQHIANWIRITFTFEEGAQ